jgi:hypothetical protein
MFRQVTHHLRSAQIRWGGQKVLAKVFANGERGVGRPTNVDLRAILAGVSAERMAEARVWREQERAPKRPLSL